MSAPSSIRNKQRKVHDLRLVEGIRDFTKVTTVLNWAEIHHLFGSKFRKKTVQGVLMFQLIGQ